jgi:ketosteroid isomerase-like protein
MNSPEAVVRAYFTALNSSDLEGILAVFADDGEIMADERPTALGLSQLRGLFTGIFQALGFARELHIDRILEEGDVAIAQTHTTGTLNLLAPDTALELVSREIFVLRRTGSEWRIVDYMFNRPEAEAQ